MMHWATAKILVTLTGTRQPDLSLIDEGKNVEFFPVALEFLKVFSNIWIVADSILSDVVTSILLFH